MPTLERLGWAVALLVLMGVAAQLLRVMQRRKAAAAGPLRVGDGEAALIVVVSAHCAICPAQKGVVAQLRQRYPALQVVTLDAEQQLAQVRALSVMTVPTTLLQGADGTLVQVNNGFIALEPLARQVESLLGVKAAAEA